MSVITGTANNDTLTGTGAVDTITGLGGDDSISAGSGDDTIDGGAGNDIVHGDAGNDVITAGRGDAISGDINNDVVTYVGDSRGLSTSIDGGSDLDTLILDFSSAVDPVIGSNNGAGSGSIAGISFFNFETLVITGSSASDSFAGGAGNDTLDGGTGDDRLDAQAGSDNTIIGGAGNDIGLIDLSGTATGLIVTFTGADSVIGGNTLNQIEGLGFKGGTGIDVVDVSGEDLSSEIFGGAGDDTLTGSSAFNDILDGGDGNDRIDFDRGDTVRGGNNDDDLRFSDINVSGPATSVDGQAGINKLTLDFSTATDAVLSSNNGAGAGAMAGISYFNIQTLVISGGAATDTLIGGFGNDTITGGTGDDTLDGGAGTNKLTGGSGADLGMFDLSTTAAGLNVVFTGANITIGGNVLSQIEGIGMKAGTGNDVIDITGEKLSSQLFGGGGDDTLTGGAAFADVLDGGDGNDLITFGRLDTVRGGNNDDVMNFTGAGPAGPTASVDGQAGNDRLNLDFSASVDAILSNNNAFGSGNIAGIAYFNVESLNITGGKASDVLVGGFGDDTISGGTGDDTIDGGAGTNTLTGGAGSDLGLFDLTATNTGLNVVFTGANITIGADVLNSIEGIGMRAGTGADVIDVSGEKLASQIFGGGGDDTLTGGTAFADVLDGGDGNDTITFDRSDTVRGGNNDDTVIFDGASATGPGASVDGQAGTDTLVLDFSTSLDAISSNNNAFGSGNIAGLSYFNFESLDITGGKGSDLLVGGFGDDTIAGGRGNDRIDGQAGTNHLDGGAGRDIGLVDLSTTSAGLNVVFTGGSHVVIGPNVLDNMEGIGVRAGSGADVIDVSAETLASELFGGAGDDTLTGGANFNDILDGQDGNDMITFGAGDTVRGGNNDDTMSFTGASIPGGASVDGQSGNDTLILKFSSALDPITSNNNAFGSGNIAGISYFNIETLVITGGKASDTLIGGFGDDTITGGLGDDRIDGQAGANTLTGGAGTDIGLVDLSTTTVGLNVTFTSGATINIGADKLISMEGIGMLGGSGKDVIDVSAEGRASELNGGGGNDTLTGGDSFADSLLGGIGNDTIHFGATDVVNSGADDDTLDFTGLTTLGTSVDGSTGNDVLTADYSAVSTNLSSSNNLFGSGGFGGLSYFNVEKVNLIGGSGNDLLVGGTGADSLAGGAGADTLQGNAGADSLTGGGGSDVFRFVALNDSVAGSVDLITDWSGGDKIDLTTIDANTGVGGDQAFVFIGAAAFSHTAGELRATTGGGQTHISGDVNGDGVADFTIDMTGVFALGGADFVL